VPDGYAHDVLVVNRFVRSEPTPPDPVPGEAGDDLAESVLDGGSDADGEFVARAHTALAALSARPGFVRGRLARSLDEPTHWCLITEWESVGAYRRALGAFEVKVEATPLLAQSLDEPSAYEELASAMPGVAVVVSPSDRATSRARRSH
jgi:quinol monooxygenase YgiN